MTAMEVLDPEVDRARAIYRFGLDRLPKGKSDELYSNFVAFEKMFGDHKDIEDTLITKKRILYEGEVTNNPLDYDSWFDYLRLEESLGNKDKIREVYERAVSNIPPAEEKRYWKRYIYIWIMWALFEEIDADELEKARSVYRECLKVIPHRKFTFAKVWLMAAQFEIRRKNLKSARQIMGNAIGIAPKGKIFKKYIEFEMKLGNIDRCRILYEKFIEWDPSDCYAWLKYAEMEKSLHETDRVRSIYELAVSQPALDTPELLWTALLQFEIDENDFERTRQLYRSCSTGQSISRSGSATLSLKLDWAMPAARWSRCEGAEPYSRGRSTTSVLRLPNHRCGGLFWRHGWRRKQVSAFSVTLRPCTST
uniref:Pre-mRNA-splicing factor Syf1-like N-terminal HAT-repeats domain-containing protein n=1 Tax=Oryza punctata TaxID=4537 RepID=A0A0E0KQY1_ORYPU